MANNKFKAAVKKAKALYKSGRYKKFSDAVKAAYKKLPKRIGSRGNSDSSRGAGHTSTKTRATTTGNRTSTGTKTITANVKIGRRRKIGRVTRRRRSVGNTKAAIEKKLGNALLDHYKTQSIKRTKQLDKTISGLKKKLKAL